jgi:hypothetical protein
MNKVYKKQGLLTLTCECGITITEATEMKILFKKPDGTKGSWTAEQNTATSIRYDASNADLDQEGFWEIQAFVTIADKDGYGEISKLEVLSNLS